MRLDEAIRLFVNNYENPNTKRAYLGTLNPLANFLGEGRQLKKIKPVHIVEYKQSLSKDLSLATVGKHYKTVKTFFNFYKELGIISESPAHVLKIKRANRYVPKSRAMPDSVLASILDFTKWDKRKFALILFFADTGCRAGGAANLRVCDINLSQMEAIVTEKGNKTRTVWFDADCRDALSKLIRDMPLSAFVFGKNGKKTTPAVLSQTIRRACAYAGVKEYGSHSLRHRKGHKLADSGIAPSIAAVILGHDDVQITIEYYYPRDTQRAAAAARQTSTGNLVRNIVIPFNQIPKKGEKLAFREG